jgi:hypothetical protein
MQSYRFARRSFIAGLGGAFGLKILLRNLEAMAQGATSPPRFLMMHWPVGTVQHHYLPTGSGSNFTFSRILAPFEPLRADTIVLYGLADRAGVVCGGGHEAGTPLATTGSQVPGCRANGGEGDDGVGGGPSFDQIFLKNVAGLARPGIGYINTICDARVDSQETSTQCLSYGYTMKPVQNTNGGTISEATPLLPELKPIDAYNKLFGGFVPGTDAGVPPGMDAGVNQQLLRALKERRSVLDFSLRELARLKTLAPGDQAPKIENHTEAIRKMERQISDQINSLTADGGAPDGGGSTGGGGANCMKPAAPDPALSGKTGSKNDYGNPVTTIADDKIHEQIGKTHAAIIRAAFQCDIIRVATFQWSPGTNHVSFAGLHQDGKTHMHHPESHKVQEAGFYNGPPPTDATRLGVYDFVASVNTWYNQKTADILMELKNAKDAFGNSLLDYTVVPYITEVAEANHSRSPKPALIFGGTKLGMQGGQFLQFQQARPHNDLWMTIAQAYFGMVPDFKTIAPTFVTNGVAAIPGLWVKPP